MYEIEKQPKISIGLPVYNGEKFLHKKIESIILQTYGNFELIISDNASIDSTEMICREFALKDKRIRYFRQEKNMGAIWNFGFVLNKAKYDYFIWTAADDMITNNFLEKTLEILLSNQNIVGCISKIEQYVVNDDNRQINKMDLIFSRFLKKLSRIVKVMETNSLYGSYEKKARTFLKKSTCQLVYALYRTDKLKKSYVSDKFLGNDWANVLSVLKEGDVHVIDEVLMYRYGSTSESGMFNLARLFNSEEIGVVCPFYPLTCWCIKNLGWKFFMKNFDYFIQINMEGIFALFIDLIRLFVRKIMNK